MLNNKDKVKQHYTKEDIRVFDTLTNFKKKYNEQEIKLLENNSKFEEKYTMSDYNNFNLIIKNHDTEITNNVLNHNFQKQKDSDYNKNDLKNFEKIDNHVHVYSVNNVNLKIKTKNSKMEQIYYKKNDLKNFNLILQNQTYYEKNSSQTVSDYDHKNSKLKKENLNLKKIKILYFD